MIAKGKMKCSRRIHPSAADRFYSLARKALLLIARAFPPRVLQRQNLGSDRRGDSRFDRSVWACSIERQKRTRLHTRNLFALEQFDRTAHFSTNFDKAHFAGGNP